MATEDRERRGSAPRAGTPARPDASDPAATPAPASSAGEHERLLDTVFDNLPGMVYRCDNDPDWTMEFVSETCRELTGYTPADLVANRTISYGDLIHPDDRERVWDSIEAAVDARVPWTTEYRIACAGGGEKWVWERGEGVRDQAGTLVYLEGFVGDVTDTHLARQELAASREELALHSRIATVFLTSPADTMFADVLDVVRKALASRWGFFGYIDGDGTLVAPSLTHEVWDECQVEGKELRFPPDTWGDSLWARALRAGTTQILRSPGVVPDGHLPMDRAVAVPLVFRGETIGVFIIANKSSAYTDEDVRLLESIAAYAAPVLQEWRQRLFEEQARVTAEASLRQSESLYRTLFEQSPAGVLLYDTELLVVDCNESFARTIGSPREAIIGLEIPRLRDQRPLAALRAAVDGEIGSYEGPYLATTSGHESFLTLESAPRRGAGDEIVGGIGVIVDRGEQVHAEREMDRLRLHDTLTGLPNRDLLADRLTQTVAHAQRRRLGFAVAALALDRFQDLVSTLGHEAGDRLVVQAAERLTEAMRTEDTVACFAGSEFGFVLPGIGGPTEATVTIEKVMRLFARPFHVDAHEIFLTLSLGVAVFPADGADPQELIENAEAAARRVSSEGGNSWQFFHNSMNEERAGRVALEAELHRAVEHEQFALHYQPVVDASSGKIVGVEALLRWEHPERGLVPPLDFIPLAEDTGLILPIGNWVLRTACVQAKAWSRSLGRPVRMAVNLSARQLYDRALEDTVTSVLKESGLPAAQLELEITETAAMRNPREAARILRALKARGVRIALDDFGTGYSSLSHLVGLPIATVKIDRSFVRDLLAAPERAAIVAAVIALGHRLDLTVVGEGVETMEERAFLCDEGCDAVQGFLFSRPLPAKECGELLAAGLIAL
jgi:diguanylate cyclase (GGDEF)-like protein/PAS domain S-box-containing protein